MRRLTIRALALAALGAVSIGAFGLIGPADSQRVVPAAGRDAAAAEAHLEALVRSAPRSQRDTIIDGVDGPAYRAAVDRSLRCLTSAAEASGLDLTVDGPTPSLDGFVWRYTFALPGDQPAGPVLEAEHRCRDLHLNHVEAAFQVMRLADDGYVDTTLRRFRGCLADAGLVLDEAADPRLEMASALGATPVDADLMSAVGGCAQRYPSVVTDPFDVRTVAP